MRKQWNTQQGSSSIDTGANQQLIRAELLHELYNNGVLHQSKMKLLKETSGKKATKPEVPSKKSVQKKRS